MIFASAAAPSLAKRFASANAERCFKGGYKAAESERANKVPNAAQVTKRPELGPAR
jgi:hypothetical protein